MPGIKKYTEGICFYVTEEMRKQLREYAKEHKVNETDVLREAIRKYINGTND